MADIVLPYAPADGATLDPDELSKDLYETPNNLVAGRYSLYETSNGRIELANYAAGFKIRSHMVRPWQASDAVSAGLVDNLDFFSNAWGSDEKWYGVAGAQVTWYQEYDCTWATFLTSFFAAVWRQRGKNTAPGVWEAAPRIVVQMFHNGVGIPHTKRDLPETIKYSTSNTDYAGGFDFSFAQEERNTRHQNVHHTRHLGGDATKKTGPLLKGMHSVGLHVYMQQNTGTDTELDLDGNTILVASRPDFTFRSMHRVRLCARHIDVVGLL